MEYKVGDLVKLNSSTRRNGRHAGKLALIVDFDKWENPVLCIEGEVRFFHHTQIGDVINGSR